jgi:hypothetical protein
VETAQVCKAVIGVTGITCNIVLQTTGAIPTPAKMEIYHTADIAKGSSIVITGENIVKNPPTGEPSGPFSFGSAYTDA